MGRIMREEIEILRPEKVRNRFHHVAGMVILALNSVRHRIRGYRTPRPRGTSDLASVLEYDTAVFENWRRHFDDYLPQGPGFEGRRVLEIGPGPDLGTGLLALAHGAESYTAVDAHPLITRKLGGLHADLATLIASRHAKAADRIALQSRLLEAVENLHADRPSILRYHHLPSFDLSRLEPERFDLFVSHSAFEHLSRPRRSLAQLSALASERAHLVAEIDLQTHTRWIRNVDPLNIYRYSGNLYASLRFSGSPNRFRPDDYLNTLESEGWVDLRIYPQRVLEPDYVELVEPSLDPRFQGDPEHLGWMTITLCASRRGERSWVAPQQAEEDLPEEALVEA